MVVIGIHDSENGSWQSGWVALNAGVSEEEQTNHSHWHYDKSPEVLMSQLDANLGNPAHVYEYQGDIFLANDKTNGFTILPSLAMLKSPATSAASFYMGGGDHITLAAVNRRIACITNPGEGSIWVLSLAYLEVESKNQVNGAPTRILAIGG